MSDSEFDAFFGGTADASNADSELDDVFGDGNLFDGVNMEELPDDPFALPKNVYKFRVSGDVMSLKPTQNDPNKWGIMFRSLVAEGPFQGRAAQEWFRYPRPTDAEDEKIIAQASLNNLMTNLGFTEDEKAKFNHRTYRDLLTGREFMGEAESVPDRKDPSRKNIKIYRKMPVSGAPFGGTENPFA